MAAKAKKVEKELPLSETPAPVVLSKRAINQLKEAIKREEQPKGSGLRVMLVQVANGYRYDMQFDTKGVQGDHISLQGGLKVYVDSFAANALQGYEIDYKDFPGPNEWGGFVFESSQADADA